ncbi:hypothetical protein ACOMHN_027972 [Nucella lapillus]
MVGRPRRLLQLTLPNYRRPRGPVFRQASQGGERKLTSRCHRSHRTFCGPSVTGLPGSLTAVVRDAESPCAFTLADSQAGNTGSRRRGETTISPLDPRLGERTPSGHQIAFTWSYSFALVTSDSVEENGRCRDKQKQHGIGAGDACRLRWLGRENPTPRRYSAQRTLPPHTNSSSEILLEGLPKSAQRVA